MFIEENIEKLINYAVKNCVFPGGSALISYSDNLIYNKGFGSFSYENNSKKVNENTIYDLASLTKVIAAATAVMILKDKGEIDIEKNVNYYIPEYKGEYKDLVKVRHLLNHSSGLPPWKPLFESSSDKQSLLENLYQIALEANPGVKCDYSDLGYILLGEIIERITSAGFDKFCSDMIYKPLDMENTFFCPPEDMREKIPPTEDCKFRGRVIQGEVHDENAYVMGGISGHAGLFSNSSDIANFCQMIMNGGDYKGINLIHPDTVKEFTARTTDIPDCKWALGWRMFMGEGDVIGSYFSENSFGHLGYTGTSMWIDPLNELFIILLTNRVHPTRENNKITEFRPNFHDEILMSIKDIAV